MSGLLIFLLIVSFLLFCNIKFIVTFENEMSVCIKYLFFKFNMKKSSKEEENVNNKTDKKEKINKETNSQKEKNKKNKNKNKSNSKDKIKKIISEKGLSGFLKIIKNLLKILKNLSIYLLKRIYVVKFYLEVKVSQEDSAQTAIKYGQACAVLYPAMNFIFNNLKVKNRNVKIYPDFNSEKSSVYFSAIFKIRLIYILKAGLVAFFKFIMNFISLKNLKIRKV